MKLLPYGIVLFLLIPLSWCYSQEEQYKIGHVVYQIEGRVRERALNAILDWDYRMVFSNRWELETYLREQKQILINTKVFKSVNIDYHRIDEEGDSAVVEILLQLSEAWPIYPIPVYKYDSNYGTVIGLGTTYYDFAGTLTDLGLSGFYSPGKSEISTTLDGVRLGALNLNIGLSQLWEEVKAINEKEEINLQYTYAKTMFNIGVQFHLMKNLDYSITPTIVFPSSYSFEKNDTDKENDFYIDSGPTPSISHLILYDRVNWIGNLRQGFSVSLENGIDYQSENDENTLWVDGILTSFVYAPVINYSSRFSSFFFNDGYRENSGDRMRGILDYKLTGTWGFFWNQNFVIPVVKIPSVMDFHMTPFFDMGFIGDRNSIFKRDEMLYTAGISLSVFPAPLPNVQISMDYGINLRETDEREILISSVLFF